MISMVSRPGTGKTTLLENMLTELQLQFRVAALLGDLATDNDAMRLARSKAPIRQITTGTICHLEAAIVEKALGTAILLTCSGSLMDKNTAS